MKKLLIVALLMLGFVMAGCGVVDTHEARMRRARHIHALQARMLVDDWDHFWMYDQSTRLSQWHVMIDQ